jgi:hypothetical protein
MIAAELPVYFNLSRLNLSVLLAVAGALVLLSRQGAPVSAVSSKPDITQSRKSSGSNEHGDSVARSVPQFNPVANLGHVQRSSAPARQTPPLIVLAENVRVRPARVKGTYRLPRLDLLDNPPRGQIDSG